MEFTREDIATMGILSFMFVPPLCLVMFEMIKELVTEYRIYRDRKRIERILSAIRSSIDIKTLEVIVILALKELKDEVKMDIMREHKRYMDIWESKGLLFKPEEGYYVERYNPGSWFVVELDHDLKKYMELIDQYRKIYPYTNKDPLKLMMYANMLP